MVVNVEQVASADLRRMRCGVLPIKFSQPDSAFDAGILAGDGHGLRMSLGHAVGVADESADHASHLLALVSVVVFHLR